MIASNTKQWNVIIAKPPTDKIFGMFDVVEKSVVVTEISSPTSESAAIHRDATDRYQYNELDVSRKATEAGIQIVEEIKKLIVKINIKLPFNGDLLLKTSADTLNIDIYKNVKYPAAANSIKVTTTFLVVPTTPPQRGSLCSGNIIKQTT